MRSMHADRDPYAASERVSAPRRPSASTRAGRRMGATLALAAAAGLAAAQPASVPAIDTPVAQQVAAASAPVSASAPATAAVAQRVAAIDAAVASLRADPLLSGSHKTHTLKWIGKDDSEKDRSALDPSFVQWLLAFARFVNDTSRLLVYGLVLIVVVLLVVSARHLVRLRAFRRSTAAASAVTHVRDLDVRPESLPDDIGAAAWALWQAGRVPAALSLLYRGALSRLIHRHAVPISASTTEGECVALARDRLDPTALRYLMQLVRAWEASIYGGRELSPAMGEVLCSGFTARLDASTSTPRGGSAETAS